MLAPLKDRGILVRAAEDADDDETALRQALRHARQAQRRAAIQGARQIVALTNEIHRLTELNRQLRSRLDELESGQTLVSLGQQLMALRAENDALIDSARFRPCAAARHPPFRPLRLARGMPPFDLVKTDVDNYSHLANNANYSC